MKFDIVVFFVLCMIALSGADEKVEDEHDDDDHKEGHRPYERHISEKEHHEDDDELHDPRFDHEAFLGKDESEKFDHMSPEESKQRLGDLVDKVDKDGDKKITQEELQEWIRNIGRKTMERDTKQQFDSYPKAEDGKLKFQEYINQKFAQPEKKEMDATFKENMAREERKWKLADKDGDGSLTLEEFTAFVHPEEAPHMREVVVEEAIKDMDKDKDGQISLDEYISDHYTPTEGEKEPDWVKTEREAFTKNRDKNGDGRLDTHEVAEWLMPKDFDHSASEAKHLISKSDDNKDGVLTKEEILNNHDLFAGSQATDYGAELKHDEL